jgi:hypothetical protein
MAWYLSQADYQFTRPAHGNSGLVMLPRLSTFGADSDNTRSHYMLFLSDIRAYHQSLQITQEHGMFNDVNVNIASLACLYEQREPVMELIRVIDVGEAASEAKNGYTAPGSAQLYHLNSRYLADDTELPTFDDGRLLSGAAFFTLEIPTVNAGVHLQVRVDRGFQDGKVGAELRVNGQFVERVSRIVRNDFFRWQDLSFEIPASMTQGLTSLQIQIVPYAGLWNEYRYKAFAYSPEDHGCVRRGTSTLIDSSPLFIGLTSAPVAGTFTQVELLNAPPLTTGVLVLGRDYQDPPQFFGTVPVYVNWLRDVIFIPASSDATGRALIPLQLPDGFAGHLVHAQAIWSDPSMGGTPTLHSRALTFEILAP